jgi:DNA-binding LacI/PurR family transcriptional regulator
MRFVDSGPNGWRDPSMAAEQLASDPPDAVVCYDDKLAMALLDALRSTRLDVPGDLALMGFDGIPAARQSRPRLTTVDVPSVEIGRRAVEMLVDSTKEGKPRPSEVMPVRLIVGETTPPVRTRGGRPSRATDAHPVAVRGESRR